MSSRARGADLLFREGLTVFAPKHRSGHALQFQLAMVSEITGALAVRGSLAKVVDMTAVGASADLRAWRLHALSPPGLAAPCFSLALDKLSRSP